MQQECVEASIIGFNNKMKKEYSFKDSSRLSIGPMEHENRYSYGSNKPSQDSWTDMRVEEIKRKYETPSHRKTSSNFSKHERSRESLHPENTPTPKYHLKESSYLNRLDSHPKPYMDSFPKKSRAAEEERMPSFNSEAKQNEMIIQKFSQIKSCLKNEFSRAGHKEVSHLRDYPQNKIDPRVQNIDKINSKIKKILECLHENDDYVRKQKNDFSSSFLKGSVVSRGNNSEKEELEETKILSRQKVAGREAHIMRGSTNDFTNEISFSPKDKRNFDSINREDVKASTSYFKESTVNYNSPYKKLEHEKTVQDSWFETKIDHNRNRARSCLGDVKNQDYRLSSGKKLDDQISRTTNRIRALEEEKKKLNIQFKPYHHELRANRSTSNLNERSYRNSRPPLPKAKASQHYPYSHGRAKTRQSFIEKSKTETNEFDYNNLDSNGRRSLFEDRDFKKIYLPVQKLAPKKRDEQEEVEKSARFPGEKSSSDEATDKPDESINEGHRSELKLKTEEGIENRKKKLLQTATVTFAHETKRLIQNLFEQVKKDEQFRNAKIWLRDLCDSNKWEDIYRVMRKQGIEVDREKVQRIFQVTEEEDNPFFSNRSDEFGLDKLVSCWKHSEQHWQQEIVGQFDLKEFEAEKFTSEKLDMEKKGYFTVQDLVRFLNMETGTFYRNRDLILVFRRFTKGSKYQWDDLMSQLDKHSK